MKRTIFLILTLINAALYLHGEAPTREQIKYQMKKLQKSIQHSELALRSIKSKTPKSLENQIHDIEAQIHVEEQQETLNTLMKIQKNVQFITEQKQSLEKQVDSEHQKLANLKKQIPRSLRKQIELFSQKISVEQDPDIQGDLIEEKHIVEQRLDPFFREQIQYREMRLSQIENQLQQLETNLVKLNPQIHAIKGNLEIIDTNRAVSYNTTPLVLRNAAKKTSYLAKGPFFKPAIHVVTTEKIDSPRFQFKFVKTDGTHGTVKYGDTVCIRHEGNNKYLSAYRYKPNTIYANKKAPNTNSEQFIIEKVEGYSPNNAVYKSHVVRLKSLKTGLYLGLKGSTVQAARAATDKTTEWVL